MIGGHSVLMAMWYDKEKIPTTLLYLPTITLILAF
jgi:hypothetical protein